MSMLSVTANWLCAKKNVHAVSSSFHPSQVGPIRSFQTAASEGSFSVNDLAICQKYWVTTTAVNCGTKIRSEPAFIDVHDPADYVATINIGTEIPCSQWVNAGQSQKKMDVNAFVLEALNDACSYPVSCVANVSFACRIDDASKVNVM